MYLVFVILMVIAAILMCFIVLIQNSKGGGLASGFSSSNAIMGVRKTTDFLEKATWGLAAFMVVMSIATAYVVPTSSSKTQDVILSIGFIIGCFVACTHIRCDWLSGEMS